MLQSALFFPDAYLGSFEGLLSTRTLWQVDLRVDDTFQLRHSGDSTIYVTGTYSNDDDSANKVSG